ncbi:PREDICTED: protein CER1-like 1 isoform X3 [Camelina sativa]|uniref:Protein CER1-like 1 isoform X3 n=1 Tax=Camelina sativa TaxID=90675 RepID=A0ABM1Q7Y9_CAMSA|nr:PREDICTED: protein CER1-like 1 isoform X3 [Camelina sativa]
MASRPGVLTEWPWSPLGDFKYLLVVPLAIASIISYMTAEEEEKDLGRMLIVALMLWRIVHSQIWISVSRQKTAKGTKKIVYKPIEFEQVDRERSWDDQIIFNTLFMYLLNSKLPGSSRIPIWRLDGAILIALIHAGPVEFLYYWFHRALHHHFLYSRYHSHHHSSIVTKPITSVVHPFAEHIAYTILFAIPIVAASLCGILSIFSFLCYTPSFHSLHHTQFRTNYSLFMPIYDYIYGTTDKCTESLYENSLEREEESPDVIHLTHLTTLDSIYQMRLGFPSFSSRPLWSRSPWYLTYSMWPFTLLFSFVLTSAVSSCTFVFERNRLRNLIHHSHLLPKFGFHYKSQRHHRSINNIIEAAIIEADEKGVKVMSLGLMNTSEELNGYGELYVQKHPNLKIRLVDGSSMAAAVVVNSIPTGTTEVVFRGNLTKIASAIVFSLSQKGIKVVVLREEEYTKLIKSGADENLVLFSSNNCYSSTVWLVGDGLGKEEQMKAKEGTLFIPFSQFPPDKLRKDCFYHPTPAMLVPKSAQNIDSCENWLGRRVMSAWRIGGIVHALEGWEEHDCGNTCKFLRLHAIWEAALRHDFQPLQLPPSHL